MPKKTGLGRGLDVYFSEKKDQSEENNKDVQKLRIALIEPNRNQPRKEFDSDALFELSESIKIHGLLQPLLVKPLNNGQYQIIAGERRWRASKMAGLSEIPVIIKDISEKETAEIALVENLQRENLNPVEEALGYKTLMDSYELTQEEISERVGRSRSAVANRLRLLNLSDNILDYIKDGKISAGHGIAILALQNEEDRKKATELALKGANVREIENLSKQKSKSNTEIKPKKIKSTIYSEIELSLKNTLHRKVKINENNGKGTLQIEFFNENDLIDLIKNFE